MSVRTPRALRGFFALLVAVLCLGLLAPSPALALSGPAPLPVSQPGSVIGSFDLASPIERARAVGNTVPQGTTVPSTPVPKGQLGSIGSGLGTAVAGLSIGWQVGSLVNSGLCAAGASLWCPTASFVPNADVTVTTGDVGWVPGQSFSAFAFTSYPAHQTASVNVNFYSGTPVYGQQDNTPVIDWSESGPTTYNAQGSLYDYYICRNTSTNALSTYGAGQFGSFQHLIRESGRSAARAWSCPSGSVFDYAALGQGPTYPSNASDASNDFVRWYPVGHPDRPPDVSANPTRKFSTTWKCQTTSALSTFTALSTGFTDTDSSWPAPPDADCSAGLLDYMKVEKVTPDGSASPMLISEWQRSDGMKDWQAAFPDCETTVCELDLQRLESGVRTSCFDEPSLCLHWFASPTKTSDFKCVYAGVDVALSQCNAYATIFDPETATRAKAGGGEETNYADPATGANTDAGVGTSTGDDSGCPPDINYGLSLFKPWYYWKAMTCALSWAFIPTDLSARVTSMQADFTGTDTGSWFAAVGSTFDEMGGIGGGGSCEGPVLTVDIPPVSDPISVKPLNACDEPLSTVAGLIHGLLSLFSIVGGLFAAVHMLGSALGMSVQPASWQQGELF